MTHSCKNNKEKDVIIQALVYLIIDLEFKISEVETQVLYEQDRDKNNTASSDLQVKELRAEITKLTKNAWEWSRGLKGQKAFSKSELLNMFGPYLESGSTAGLSPREARLLETLVETGAENQRLEKEIKSIQTT